MPSLDVVAIPQAPSPESNPILRYPSLPQEANTFPSKADRSETEKMHHQQQLCDSFPSHKSPNDLAEPGLVLELTRTTLPRSRVSKHVLAIELPQVSM